MKTQTKWIIGIGIILVALIFIVPKLGLFSSQTYAVYYDSNLDNCNSEQASLQSQGYACVMPCFQVTSTITNCMAQFGSTLFSTRVGQYITITSTSTQKSASCTDYYKPQINNQDNTLAIAMYKCISIFQENVGSGICIGDNSCAANTCSTTTCTNNCGVSLSGLKSCSSTIPGDTNGDGKVDRTELGVIINNWIAGTASRTDLGSAISSWVAG